VNTDVTNVTESIRSTVVDVWMAFLGHVPYLAAGLAVLILTWLVAAVLERISNRLLQRARMRRSLRDLLVRLISIGVWGLGFLLSAMVMFPGLTPARALGALGLVSIAVGLAFKDIFENFFAGILILWRFPFERNDYIECEGLVGRVEDVMVRMTIIQKQTGELVVIPNSMLFKNPVQVLTYQTHRRTTISSGIAYSEDVSEAVDVIRKAVETCETVNTDHAVQIFPKEFASSGIEIEVTWWTGARPVELRQSRGEVITAIKSALDDAGIEIPFPYRTLVFKEPIAIDTSG